MRFLRRWRDSRSGGIALITAFAVPPIALLICGSIDFASVVSDKSAFQNVADATALQAALQVGVSDPTGIAARDDLFARQQLKELSSRAAYTVTTKVAPDNSLVTVTISGTRTSFFMNMLPPGGWKLGATANAAPLSRTSFFMNLLPPGGWKLAASAKAAPLSQIPLCVLATGSDGLSNIKMDGQSQLTVNDCMVQSNKDISATQSAWLTAQVIQSSGLSAGNLKPKGRSSAPAIDDPFTNLPLGKGKGIKMNLNDTFGACLPVDQILAAGLNTLPPGVHCGNLEVHKDTTLNLLPGEHYFIQGNLTMDENAAINGDDVILVFDKTSHFTFKDSAQINLSGRKSGPLAGFVIATTRANDGTFQISSDSARKMLGTIYIPAAKLLVTGGQDKVADQSAWTVIVAKSIEMHGGPNLVVNANYKGSVVPVPQGVGPGANSARLIR